MPGLEYPPFIIEYRHHFVKPAPRIFPAFPPKKRTPKQDIQQAGANDVLMKHLRPAGLRLTLHAFALVLLCFAPAPGQTPPAAPLTGKIAHITIVGTKTIPTNIVRAVLTLKPGDAYTPEAAAKDAAALKGMGVFQTTMSVSASLVPTGIDLIYTVNENPIVRGIKFTANTPNGQPSVPAADLLAQMKTPIGQVMNTNILVKDLSVLFDHSTGYFTNQGYLADVSTDINIDPKTGVITIPLNEYRIKSIAITGNSHVKTADILAQMHIKAGDLFDKNALASDAASISQMGQFRPLTKFIGEAAGPAQVSITLPVVELAPATGVLDEKQGKVIPFLYDPITVSVPIIQVSVNGKPPLPFIVDTGTAFSVSLDFWAAKKLGLSAKGITTTNYQNVAYTQVPIHGIVLQGAEHTNDAAFDTQEAVVLDLSMLSMVRSGPRIAGIIGLGLLATTTSRFDFAQKTLTIWTAPHAPLHMPQGIVLPLSGSDTFTARAAFAPGTYADLIVDTGSDSTQIPLLALKSLHPTAITYNTSTMIDGDYVCPELRLPKISFGSLCVTDVVVDVKPPPTGPSLGLDILSGYRLTLDGPNGQLILEPSAQSRRYRKGHSGLDIKQGGKRWFVSRLKVKLPAQSAGLQVGDELVTVSGVGVKGLSLDQVGKELSGLAGVPVQTTVRREGKLVTLTWVPIDAFQISPSVIDGLTMRKTPNGAFWIIKDVLQGCPGSLAGLQAGDKVTRINGHPVTDKPTESNMEAKEPALALFEIERPGVAKPFVVWLSVVK